MMIEIDDRYVKWVIDVNEFTTTQEVTDYINEVLRGHEESWNLDDSKFLQNESGD